MFFAIVNLFIKIMHKIFIVIVCLVILFARTSNAQVEPDTRRFVNLNNLPTEASSVSGFVPSGWIIEKQIKGDINFDSKPDVILGLVENDKTPDDERYRALLIIVQKEDGKLMRLAVADRLLADFHSGGMKCCSDCENVSIKLSKKGVLTVYQCLGGADLITYTHRFRYNVNLKRMELIGIDSENGSPAYQMTVSSINYLTHRKIITRIDDKHPKGVTKRGTVSANKKFFIEDIDNEVFQEDGI